MTETGIKTEKLNIGYRSDLIRDISLSVSPGKIVTLIGPNGSGKSTLLKTLTGELKERGGLIYLNGEDRSTLKSDEIAKRLSVVMTYKIRPELMTCREVVEVGRYPYTGMLGLLSDADHKKVDEAMEWTSVAELSDELFENISDGQKQRVLLARAICQEPEVLVLDEPTSFLDIRHKIDILEKIMSFAKEKNVSVLMSLHELEIAKKVSDTVVALGEGQVQKIGTPEEVFTESFIRKLYHIENTDTHLLGEMPWSKDKEPAPEFTPRGKAKAIMIQGTMSNAGKSLIAAGLCRIFKEDGYRVVPFKAQNMSLNSYITNEGLEMGRAQVMQAECAGAEPKAIMNPILLKPVSAEGSQVIINGRVAGNMKASDYYKKKTELKKDILKSYDTLSEEADIIVIEGAGSPVEMNLKDNDVVNMWMANAVNAPVLLVGDIDRGGVFAQLLGTLELLEGEERARVQGLIVNKFRGDRELFNDGVRILEERSKKKVVGVVPYLGPQPDDEDSLSERLENVRPGLFDIAVIRLKHISNFTDFNTFEQIAGVTVRYVWEAALLGDPDMIIIPGTKNTVEDLREIKRSGMADAILKKQNEGTCIFGICGGYQMLGRKVDDPSGIEQKGSEEGLNLLPVDTVIEEKKVRNNIRRKITGATGILEGLSGAEAEGYEIHMGRTAPFSEVTEFTDGGTGYCKGNVYGTYLHGFFDKKDVLCPIIKKIALKRGRDIDADTASDYKEYKDRKYDLLAEGLRKSIDMEYIYKIMGLK